MELREPFLGGFEFSSNSDNKVISQHFCNSIDDCGKIGVRDSISYEKNITEKRIGMDILTGDEDWFFDDTTKTYYYFQYNKFNENIGGSYDKMMCTHFRWTEYNTNIEYGQFQGGAENQIMFNYDFGKAGVENFKNWLREQYTNPSKTPVKVLYTLQYPILQRRNEIYIPSPRFIPAHVSVNSNDKNAVQPILHVKYQKYYNEENKFQKNK